MSGTRPDPLVPADVDLRDFGFMPLEVARLRRSKAWLRAKKRPELGFYMLNLWASSWHERPAASLEDDDEMLAELAMCSEKRWQQVKAEVMQGWVLCTDDRWYHPVVAEKANESWAAKVAQRARTKAATEAREARRREQQAHRDDQRNVERHDPRDDERNDQRDGSRDVHQGTVKGQGQGQGSKKHAASPPASPASVDPIWGTGLAVLTAAQVSAAGARSFIAGCLKEWPDEAVADALAEARGTADPRAYVRKLLAGKPKKRSTSAPWEGAI